MDDDRRQQSVGEHDEEEHQSQEPTVENAEHTRVLVHIAIESSRPENSACNKPFVRVHELRLKQPVREEVHHRSTDEGNEGMQNAAVESGVTEGEHEPAEAPVCNRQDHREEEEIGPSILQLRTDGVGNAQEHSASESLCCVFVIVDIAECNCASGDEEAPENDSTSCNQPAQNRAG